MKKTETSVPLVGKFILDSISIGMYNHPLMVIREYIQNSVDSIDEYLKDTVSKSSAAKIDIQIDGFERLITITDNGTGVSISKAKDLIYNIGASKKSALSNRGFRGIGRLGGLGYCKQLKFTTKAKGENIYSEATWDCDKLRQLLKKTNASMDMSMVVQATTVMSQGKYKGSKKDHFFKVEMVGVRSSLDILLDVPMVKEYLAQVAPVPFNMHEFSWAGKIKQELETRGVLCSEYVIFVNDEQLFKPYKDKFRLNSKQSDTIQNIEFFDLHNGEILLGKGWFGTLNLLGAIKQSNCIAGIKVRSDNILVGGKELLAGFFREKRFNDYLIGEIHIIDRNLTLNARRDDFEDNTYKEEFYASFVKTIGIPFSRKIREASILRSAQNTQDKFKTLVDTARRIRQKGYLSEGQKKNILHDLSRWKVGSEIDLKYDKIDSLIEIVNTSQHFLSLNHKHISKNKKKELKRICDIVYNACKDKVEAEGIVHDIIRQY